MLPALRERDAAGDRVSQSRWRAAKAAASARLRKRSFSSTWRTWVLTVASLITSRSAISRLRRPSASSAEHLALALAQSRERVGRLRRRPRELLEQAAGHRRGDARLAAPRAQHGLDQLVRGDVLEQVAGGADPQRRVQVGLVLGDGEDHHLGLGQLLRRIAAHASMPRTPGMLRSSSATSGRRRSASAIASAPSAARPTTSMRSSAREQRGRALAHQPVVVGDQHAHRSLVGGHDGSMVGRP